MNLEQSISTFFLGSANVKLEQKHLEKSFDWIHNLTLFNEEQDYFVPSFSISLGILSK